MGSLSSQPGNDGLRRRHRGLCTTERFLPGVDLMEDRTVLSPLVVTTPARQRSGLAAGDPHLRASGSTIDFAHSVHHHADQRRSGHYDNLTIDGPGANQLTVSGNNSSRVFEIGAGHE